MSPPVLRRAAAGIAPLVDAVFPPRCPLCGEAIGDPDGLCAPCWRTIELPPEPACDGCGSPIDPVPRSEARLCPACRVARPAHDGLTTATLYTEPSRRLVLALKHGRKLSLAAMMGRMIAARLPPLAPDAVIVPVPLHWSRLWARGYNQAALIARELSRRTGAAFVPDALVRRARTPKLGGLDRSQRRSVLASAGIAVRDRRVAARPILLVDDVVTSGATTDTCVAALREAGAGSVRVACFSRVPVSETPGAFRPRASA